AYFPYAETAIDNAAAQVMTVDETGLHLTLARSKPEAVRNAAYFPYAETAIDNAAAQVMTVDETGLHLTLARS
ncbi:thiol:disulfide interchange protein, partial [Methylobacterium radiotolerans]